VYQEFISRMAHDCPDLDFGEVLRDIRMNRRLILQAGAKLLGVSRSELSRWENGDLPRHFDLGEVKRIMAAFICTDVECAKLLEAFFCYTMTSRGWGTEKLESDT